MLDGSFSIVNRAHLYILHPELGNPSIVTGQLYAAPPQIFAAVCCRGRYSLDGALKPDYDRVFQPRRSSGWTGRNRHQSYFGRTIAVSFPKARHAGSRSIDRVRTMPTRHLCVVIGQHRRYKVACCYLG